MEYVLNAVGLNFCIFMNSELNKHSLFFPLSGSVRDPDLQHLHGRNRQHPHRTPWWLWTCVSCRVHVQVVHSRSQPGRQQEVTWSTTSPCFSFAYCRKYCVLFLLIEIHTVCTSFLFVFYLTLYPCFSFRQMLSLLSTEYRSLVCEWPQVGTQLKDEEWFTGEEVAWI